MFTTLPLNWPYTHFNYFEILDTKIFPIFSMKTNIVFSYALIDTCVNMNCMFV